MAVPSLQAIKYERGRLEVLDQLRLPHEFVYDAVETCEQAFDCIKQMRVRGAPAIAIVAVLALAVELEHKKDNAARSAEVIQYVNDRLDYLFQSRPTAVDLSNAITLLKTHVQAKAVELGDSQVAELRLSYIEAAEKILHDDTYTNLEIGRYGAEYLRRLQPPISTPTDKLDDSSFFITSPPNTEGLPDMAYRKLSVLTHCNTGSLATSGHGTALGIIRTLHKMNYLDHAYCTETRPYNQGSRLTAFELVYEKIPSTLITDSMAAALFALKKSERNISAVIVGADRVARNGDTANKIGTYQLAVLARYHGVKFVVAAPTTSIDLRTPDGGAIRIEERAGTEMTQISGAVVGEDGNVVLGKTARVAVAEQRIAVWNPAFDVTLAELIDAVVTEKGVVVKDSEGRFSFRDVMPERWAAVVGVEGEAEVEAGSVGTSTGTQFPMDL